MTHYLGALIQFLSTTPHNYSHPVQFRTLRTKRITETPNPYCKHQSPKASPELK